MAQPGWPHWRVLQHSSLPLPLPCSSPALLSIPWLPLGISGPSKWVSPHPGLCHHRAPVCNLPRAETRGALQTAAPLCQLLFHQQNPRFGAFPGVSCDMVPGGAYPLQSGASSALTCRVWPLGTLGNRRGGNTRDGGCKQLPCWRASRAYAHQAASPPESCGSKPLVIWVLREPSPAVGRLRASLHFPTALRSQGDPVFIP